MLTNIYEPYILKYENIVDISNYKNKYLVNICICPN